MKEFSILLLEDRQEDADLLIYYLEQDELLNRIVHVTEEKQFLKELENNPPDLILSDYHLPNYSALDALSALKTLNLDIPLIVLTAHIREEEAVECMRQGAADYILKDRLTRLPEAVRQALQKKAVLTKQQATETSLQQSEARFQNLYSSVPVALYRTAVDGELKDCNEAFLELLGYDTRESLIGENVKKLLYADPDDRDKWKSLIREDDTIQGQFKARRADDSTIWVEDFAQVARNEQGDILYFDGYVLDVTEKRFLQLEQDTISSLNANLRFVKDIDELIQIMVRNVRSVSDSTGIIIALQKKPDLMDIIHADGVWAGKESEKKVSNGSIYKQVLSSLLPYVENNWPDETIEDWDLFPGVDSLTGIPFHFQGEALGILWLGHDELFSDDLLYLLILIADIISVEFSRLNLLLANQRAFQENQALEDISQTLYQTLALEHIFKLVVEFIVDIVPTAVRAIIHIYDAAADDLYTVAVAVSGSKSSPFKVPRVTVLPDGRFDFRRLAEGLRASHMRSRQGVAGIVVAEGELVNIQDTFADDRFLHTDNSLDIHSLLAVPIRNTERTIGSISLIGEVPDAFDKSDEFLTERFSSQVMIAIENARLYEAERVQRELAQAQARISAALNKSMELDTVLQLILDQIQQVIPYAAANILLIDGQTIEIRGNRGYDKLGTPSAFQKLVDGLSLDMPTVKKVLKTRQPLIIPDTAKSDLWTDFANGESGIHSYLGIPLIVDDDIIGLLNIDSAVEGFFTPTIVENVHSFSEDAALAIQNAKLYSELEKLLENEKETRSQLIRADKLTGMGRMVASVAHELNNPLQTIKNCLFLMEQTSISDDNELLDLAMSEIQRLSGIVNRLREVYQPIQGTELEEIPLIFLLEEVRLLLEMHVKRNKVNWNLQTEGSKNYFVRGIPGQLKQVFINFGLNGIEAMQPDGGELLVSLLESTEGKEKEIGIVFRDTGEGISKDKIKFIFDPFYTTKTTGMGLGLSICYDIAQNHNGRIVVNNVPGGGAEFVLWLPLAYVEEGNITPLSGD